MVTLMPENAEAASVYRAVQGQVIVLSNGMESKIIDLNYLSVKMIMDLYEVKDQRRCFEKVTRAFHRFLRERS